MPNPEQQQGQSEQRGSSAGRTAIGDVDVDDHDQEGAGEMNLAIQAYRSGWFEEAIKIFTEAIQAQPDDPAIILSNRCAAFCRLSQRLRKIPATQSEESALYGLDPMTLVQLALKDAEKLLKLRPNWPKSFLRKGTALLLLEQYVQAKEALLEGLHLDPESKPLQDAVRNLYAEYGEQAEAPQQAGASQQPMTSKRSNVQRSDDWDCTLCLKLLYNPVTTPCGHSFCRDCLLQAMDHRNKCPMCRTVLLVGQRSFPVSVTLNNLIQRNFPEEYEERKAEMEELGFGANEVLPLFVLTVFLPGQEMALNIFEPRYRLMVRRIMEGSHRMGIVGSNPQTGGVDDIGCEVEIRECDALNDGRFYLEVNGLHRCKIGKTWEQDGYRVAQVQRVRDVVPPEGSPEHEQTMALVKEVSKLAESWMTRAQDGARADLPIFRSTVADLMGWAENMLHGSDAETFSFWIAILIKMKSAEKLQLMRLTNTRERLLHERDLLRDGHPQGCNVQ